MSTNWTERRDGVERATVSMSLHVPRPLVDWITGYSEMTSSVALDFVVEHGATLSDGWHSVSVDNDNVQPIHVDDIDNAIADGEDVHVYEGPLPILCRTTRRKKS